MYKKFIISGFSDEISSKLNEQIEVVKKLGLNYIECRGVNGKPLIDYDLDMVKQIKKQLEDNSIKLSSVGSYIGKINITDEFESHFKLFKHTVEVAKIMETDNIRIFSFFIPKYDNPYNYRDEVYRRLDKMITYASKNNIVLLHENEKEIYGDIAVRCYELMEQFYCDNFKLVFDFANFVQCGQDTIEAYDLLKKYIYYIHIKDALFKDASVTPAGLGDGHIESILRSLIKIDFKGFLSLEPHLADFAGFAKLENDTTVKQSNIKGEQAFTIAYNALQDILNRLN